MEQRDIPCCIPVTYLLICFCIDSLLASIQVFIWVLATKLLSLFAMFCAHCICTYLRVGICMYIYIYMYVYGHLIP